MSERNGYPPGVPCWVETWQDDPEAATAFYSRLFGWETKSTLPPDAEGTFHICKLRGRDVAAIGSPIPEEAPPVPAWTTFVLVESAAETADKVKAAGGKVVVEPSASLEGGSLAIVADPAGATLAVWEQAQHKGAQLVNEPGAYSMSALNTPDPDGAKRFYTEVFGWSTKTFDMGGAELVMWTVPGYVGGEPQQPVPRDVVAAMLPLSGGGDAPPPHWSVDFWIADVDDAVAKVPELGGKVLAEPTDVPNTGLRQAVVVDPQGATLSLTQPPGVS